MVDDKTYDHDAFISYATSDSGRLAAALELSLEAFGRSWDQATARDVYRDTSDQPASDNLAADLKRHLDGSGHLILLASPAAARSRWVNEEVQYWLTTKGTAKLLLAMAAGSVAWSGTDFHRSSDLPPAVFGAFAAEPKWADLRAFSDLDVIDFQSTEFAGAVADLTARITDIPKAQLVGLHWRRHREAIALRLASEALVTESRPVALHMARAAVLAHVVPATRRALAQVLDRTDGWFSIEHSEPLTALTAGPLAGSVTFGASDGTVRVLAVESGEGHSHQPGPARRITALAYSANGAHLAVGYDDGQYMVAVVPDHAQSLQGWVEGAVGSVAVSDDGRVVAAAPTSGETVVIRALAGPVIASDGHGYVRSLRFCGSSDVIVHGWSDVSVIAVGSGSLSPIARTPPLPRPGPIVLNPGVTSWAQGQLDGGAIGVWPLVGGPERLLKGPKGYIDALAFDPTGTRLVEALGREVLVWLVDHEQVEHQLALSLDAIDDVAVGPDASWVAVLGEGRAEVVLPHGRPALRTRVGHQEHDVPSVLQAALGVAFSPDGTLLAWITCPANPGSLRILDTRTYESWQQAIDEAAHLRFLDEHRVEITDIDGRLFVLDLPSGTIDRSFDFSATEPALVRYDAEARAFEWTDNIGGTRRLSLPSGTFVSSWATDPRNRLLVYASASGLLEVRDLETGAQLWAAPTSRAPEIVLDPRAELVAVVGASGRTVIMDAATGQTFLTTRTHDGPLHHAAFSADRRFFAVASPGGDCTLVHLDLDQWCSIARIRAGRSLTTDERQALAIDELGVLEL